MNFIRKTNVLVILLVSAVLISCGGGDDNSSSSVTKPAATTTTAPAPTQEPEPEPEPVPAPAPTQEPEPEPAPAPTTTCPSIHPHENFLAIGDSITAGTGDNIASDNVTADGCYKGIGFPPVLIDKLDAAKGRKHIVINKGVGGARSADGVRTVGLLLEGQSMHVLIMYGTNDSGFADGNIVPTKEFKANMQNIINKVRAAGKNAYLAKILPVLGESNHHPTYSSLGIDIDKGTRNQTIQQYNQAIDALVRENGISVRPPDFYTWFKSRPELFSDNFHPNGAGYQIMAEMWFQRLRSL